MWLHILDITKITIICKFATSSTVFGILYLKLVFTILKGIWWQCTVFTTASANFRNTVSCTFWFVELDNLTICVFRSCFIFEVKCSIFAFISATSITWFRAMQSHTFYRASLCYVDFYQCTGIPWNKCNILNKKFKGTIHISRFIWLHTHIKDTQLMISHLVWIITIDNRQMIWSSYH